jgi:signal transduction histidine kinase
MFAQLPEMQPAGIPYGSLTSAAAMPSKDRPSILLIDGNPSFRQQLKSVLISTGYLVQTAESGEEGLNLAFYFRPDAILVDGWLPGINGHIVIQRLKQDVTLRNTPCLLLTTSVEPGEEVRVLEEGADAYLRKDTGANVILARLAALLRSGVKARPVDASAASMLGVKTVLAVHHSGLYVQELTAALEGEGFTVVSTQSGREALDWVETNTVDCILLGTDLVDLPGCEVCRILKGRPASRQVPLLLLTATGKAEDTIAGFDAGADDCVPSGVGVASIRTRVRVQLRRKQFEEQDRVIREQLLHKELQAAQARAAQEIAEARAAMVGELERKNRELEAFAHSVSHDLRSPLRTIHGFTQALLEDFEGELPSGARDHAVRVMAGALRMHKLIDALLEMSRTSRANLKREPFDLSRLALSVAAELDDERRVECVVEEGIKATGDPALIRVVLDNLLRNAWKFTNKNAAARIEVGVSMEDRGPVYFVRDNGVGFDSSQAHRLFQAFERLHPVTDFPGSGIGLATVRRIIDRHGGQVWAESTPGAGATFFFTLP